MERGERACSGCVVAGGGKRQRIEASAADRAVADVAPDKGAKELEPGGLSRSVVAVVNGRILGNEPASRGLEAGPDIGRRMKSEVSNLDEAVREDVLDEAAEEANGRKSDRLSVLGAEGDTTVSDLEEAAIGDADAVGVAAQVAKDLLGPGEGRLGVDDPTELGQALHQEIESVGDTKVIEALKGAIFVEAAQGGHHLAAKERPHDVDGKEKARVGAHPAGAVVGEPSGGDDAVNVWVEAEIAGPGVKDRGDSERGAEARAAELKERATGSGKKGIEEHFATVERQRAELARQGEDDMKVLDRKRARLARCKPALRRQRLALGTVAVAARVIRRM